jgi:putative ABC transport system permease protein
MGLQSRRAIVLRSLLVDAGAALRARRMQAALSAFGIATGIASVVLLVAIVAGIHRMALQTFRAGGGNLVLVHVETDPRAGDPQGAPLTLTPEDAEAVLRSSPYFDLVSAETTASATVRGVEVQGRTFYMAANGTARLVEGSRAYTAQIRGLTESWFEMQSLAVAAGRTPTTAEYAAGARVAVLGADAARQIFGRQSPLGETVVLGDWPFQVVGVLAWVGAEEGEFRSSTDRYVYLPFRAVAGVFREGNAANQLSLRITTPGTEEEAVADARGVLTRRLQRHGRTDGQIEFSSSADRLREFSLVLNALKLAVALVGGIGLFVGSVGVANVLLVSVRERTSEIGVRRAVGARRQDIFIGFLFEALAITLGGGLLGISTAWLLTQIARFLPIPEGAEPHISLVTAAAAVSLLVIVGIAAGVGPARRAAAVYPVEALRAE